MKIKLSRLAFIAASLTMVCCGQATDKKTDMTQADTSLTEAEIQAGILTPEVMWKLGRVGSSSVSPDGKSVVYAVKHYIIKENRGINKLFVSDLGTPLPIELTDGSASDTDPQWSGDGAAIYFISDRSGSAQVWKTDAAGMSNTEPVQITDIEGGIDGFQVAPSGGNILYVQRVKVDGKRSSDKYPDLEHSHALIYDGLMARHWDRWTDGTHLHIFVAQISVEPLKSGLDIMEGEAWDAPMEPYFDMGEIAWNNTGTLLAYTCKKMTGKDYALSTDSDIYLYDMAKATTRNLTEGMVGYDRYPRFSPNDSRLAFTSMPRPGNESDKQRLMVMDMATGDMHDLSTDFDYSAQNVAWDDNNHLFFIAAMNGTNRLCHASLEEGQQIRVTLSGDYDINHFSISNRNMVAEIASISMPTELYKIEPYSGQKSQFTSVNSDIMNHIGMGKVQRYNVPTTDGKEMLTWVIFPPDFDPAKKYPTLLYCQGGPQNTVSQFWSYRWNFQLMAARGYIVVAPNRRGVPSFGQEWLDQISGDYSGQNIRDYLSAIDFVAKEPWVDKDRLGCVGASYGGYSVFYLAGHHQKRFKGFIAHCGMFNLESMFGSTEELWFTNNDLGGSYWSDDATAKRSYAASPHRFVKNWDTPIMIITGANDFRIPYTESLQAFTAAQLVGVPSRLVFFEDEAHQIFKPQNSLTWNREFFDWLDTYVKGKQ